MERFLQQKNFTEALNTCLQGLPGAGKSEEVKVSNPLRQCIAPPHYDWCQETNTALLEKVFAVGSDADLTKAVAALSLENCDQLMKYLYKLMGRSKNCATILKLHAQVVEKAGVGSIVRVLTDRRQV